MKVLLKLLGFAGRFVRESNRDFSDPGGGGCARLGGRPTLWIAWEEQRRTLELSRCLGIPLYRFLYAGPKGFRYPVLAAHTLRTLLVRKPSVVIVQNPSLVLVLFCVLVKPFLRMTLIVDRHTYFMLGKKPGPKKTVFTLISDFTLRRSDLTIVTNRFLADLVETKGGASFVLPDRIPDLPDCAAAEFGDVRSICFICTYAADEPFREVLSIVDRLPADGRLFVTGNPAKVSWTDAEREFQETCPQLQLTGFLSEEDYVGLLRGADVVMDLTTSEHCLVCGAYEAIAVGRALVLSDRAANRELFGDVPVYVGDRGEEILTGLLAALDESEERAAASRRFEGEFVEAWNRDFDRLCLTIVSLARNDDSAEGA